MAVLDQTRASGSRPGPAPGGPPRRHVAEVQRSRLLSAAADAVSEVGYARMTVAEVIARARVSRKTFYDVFSDREDCFMAAFEQAVGRGRAVAGEAYARERCWQDGIRSALAALLAAMDDEPGLTKLCVVDALGAGERVLARRAEVLDEAAAVVDRGRGAGDAAGRPPDLTAQGVVGAVMGVLHSRLLEGGGGPLSDLLPPLMSIIVLPYLGPEAARAELERPSAGPRRNDTGARRPARRDPLEGVNMRLTYRTVRVLTVIAERPGASNREIAQASGVADQGQISKLLGRLARLRLVENVGAGQERGGANAWRLTSRGAAIERATRG